nr:FAD binding domain-containing protein [Roseococcus sp. MDT2-1-1]
MEAAELDRYWRPRDLRAALDIRAGEGARPLAGGTDIYPARAHHAAWEGSVAESLLDLSAIAELRTLERDGRHWRLGAGVTWAALRDAALPPGFRALQQAARQVGGRQVQARGTIGGNLCNASPAADGVPPLLLLAAEAVLLSPVGERRLPLDRFILGNRRTVLRDDEILAALLIPAERAEVPSAFVKLGARRHLVISIAMAAADAEGRATIGACSEVAHHWNGEVSPISDIRGSAEYRREAAAEVVSRALTLASAA